MLGRQTYRESFVPEPSISDVEVAIEKMKRYKSPGSDHISAEVFQSRRGGHCNLTLTNLLS
jgi:hypothetical protein